MLSVLIVSGASAPAPVLCAQRECAEPQPTGFRLLNSRAGPLDPWDRPWALARTKSGTAPLRVHRFGASETSSPIPLRLDDGTTGRLHVIERECSRGEDCSPYDCGCTARAESYWIEIRRRDGSLLSRKHLWAVYARFQIVAVDLIDGPGDELLVARTPAHASPPIGWDLKIWRIGTQIAESGSLPHLTYSLPSNSAGCAWWIAMLTVDTNAAKPRDISVRTEFGRVDCCTGVSTQHAASLKLPHALRFDAKRQQYVLTGPAPSAFGPD